MFIQIKCILFNVLNYLLCTCIYKYRSMCIQALTHNIYMEKIRFKMHVATIIALEHFSHILHTMINIYDNFGFLNPIFISFIQLVFYFCKN